MYPTSITGRLVDGLVSGSVLSSSDWNGDSNSISLEDDNEPFSTPSYILTYRYMRKEGVSVLKPIYIVYMYWNDESVTNLEVGRSAVHRPNS